jgi:DNA-binding response OmpR family regulator
VVAAHRRLYPRVGLVVAGVGDQPDAVAPVLDAGADDCLRTTEPRELAARLKALTRRRLMTSNRPHDGRHNWTSPIPASD